MRLRPGEVLERGGRGERSDRDEGWRWSGGRGAGWRQSDVGKRELVQTSSSSGHRGGNSGQKLLGKVLIPNS